MEDTIKSRLLAYIHAKRLKIGEFQKQYVDIFFLSFYLAGINMVDLFSLPLRNDDRLEYTRSKTGIPCSVKMPESAIELFHEYSGKEHMLIYPEKWKSHKNFLMKMNYNLQSIGGVWNKKKKRWGKGLFPDITSYWARHTWSTIASELDIPDAVIDMALVHKPLYKMSDIYIRRNQQKVDVALKTVSDYVNMKINEDKEKTSEK